MAAYAIFTSYARLDAGKPFKKYVKGVRELVQSKTGLRDVDRICFVDGEGIKIGDEWTNVLADGVRTSEVLVCLISPNYLGSSWCGRELEIFLQRLRSQNPAPPMPYIFPVWWELLPGRSLPARLAAYQNNEDAFPPRYREKGLRQLAALPKFRGVFLEFLETLTDRIRDAILAPSKLPAYANPVIDFSTIPSAFDDPIRAYDLEVLALHVSGEAWKPAGNLPSLAETVSSVCGRMRILGRFVSGIGAPVAAVRHAQDNRQVLLCVADKSDATAFAPLQLLNGCAAPNLAFLLIDADVNRGTAPPPITQWAIPFGDGSIKDAIRDGRAVVAAPHEMPAILEKLICKVRTKLIDLDTPARVENATLVAFAKADGVPTEQRPNLNGPGGGAST